VGVNAFAAGAIAVGIISGAYQSEVFRGAFAAIARGELEAARSVGMSRPLLFRRIIVPQALRFAIPGLGNVWQLALKESALISVVGLTEILRQAQVGAGSTRQPFEFFITAGGALSRALDDFRPGIPARGSSRHARRAPELTVDFDFLKETVLLLLSGVPLLLQLSFFSIAAARSSPCCSR
jgi:hypothetical protein